MITVSSLIHSKILGGGAVAHPAPPVPTPMLVLVWEENGEELQSLTFVLEMIAPMDGVRVPTVMLYSVHHLMIIEVVTLPPSLLITQTTKGYVGGPEDIKKAHQMNLEMEM